MSFDMDFVNGLSFKTRCVVSWWWCAPLDSHTRKFILTTRCAKAHFEPKGAHSPEKNVIAVTKLSTFDTSLNAVSSGSDG